MMKFFVVVNKKYLVLVDAKSNYNAEHIILDDVYDGMKYAQAFSMKETNTDTFKWMCETCQTISLDELKQKAKRYKEIQDQIYKVQADRFTAEKELKELLEKIKSKEEQISTSKEDEKYFADKLVKLETEMVA